MTWARLDDRFPEHPKVVGLSDAAFRLHIKALCYVARNRTDGHLPNAVPRSLGGMPRQVAELLSAAVWEKNGDAWIIHDYLDYNPSRAELAEMAAKKAKAGAKGAARRWG
jgi:hypothetical protein